MRYLSMLTTLALTTLASVACTTNADIANTQSSDAEGGNGQTEQLGGGAAGAASTGGSASGGTSSQQTTVEDTRSTKPSITAPEISDAEYATFIAESNTFGLALAQQVEVANQLTASNSVFSPVSAQIALAMTYAGANGATATAMATTLRDSFGPQKYHAGCNRLLRDLASRNYEGKQAGSDQIVRLELAPANSLWVERGMSIKTSFLDLLSEHYDSGMRRVDFQGQAEPSRVAINDWVLGRTHDRIKDLLLPGDITSATRLVLVNALYLYANWMDLFIENSTTPSVFHSLDGTDVEVAMMHGTRDLRYKSGDTAEVIELPYVTGKLWMTLVLPEAGQFENVRASATGPWLAQLRDGMTSTSVRLSLPKFKLETAQLDLTQSLVDMGMGPAFGGSADFTGITDSGPLGISKVVQKAFIGLDEKGTEAAAATAVVTVGMVPLTPVAVTFDRPFLFFIQDTTGLVLFSGHVVKPTQ